MLCILIIFFIVIYLLNLEFNPSLGNIWIRPDEFGIKRIVLKNVLNFFVLPLKNIEFWKPKFWDVNPYTFFIIIFGFFYLFKKLYNN
jgi:antibiotic biosynthesis monooxygenase (ABM) superfamily enzyme